MLNLVGTAIDVFHVRRVDLQDTEADVLVPIFMTISFQPLLFLCAFPVYIEYTRDDEMRGVAPGADTDALAVLRGKASMRVVLTRVSELSSSGIEVKSVIGGFLVQDRDTRRLKPEEIRVASKRGFTPCELEDALFAWRVVKHVRSNAIVFVRDRAVIGIGGGQTSRVDAVRQAISRAGRSVRGGFVVASDAYFPFADGVVEAVGAGASAVIQPGGSIRDDQVIEAADVSGIAMGFTGIRHFRH